MKVFSPGYLLGLMEEAEALGIRHGLDPYFVNNPNLLVNPNAESFGERCKRLSALIEERRERPEQHARLRSVGRVWGIESDTLSRSSISEIRTFIDEQRKKFGISLAAHDECSIARCLDPLSGLVDIVQEYDYNLDEIPVWPVHGLLDLSEFLIYHSIRSYRNEPHVELTDDRYRNAEFIQDTKTDREVLLLYSNNALS